jgi:PAS domain-containing protein
MGPKRDDVKNLGERQAGLVVILSSLPWFFPSAAQAALSDPAFDNFDHGRLIVLSALAAGAVALAIATALWALAEQKNTQVLRRALKASLARSKAALGERDALLGAGREALVVWGREGVTPLSYGGGEALLKSCLKGADAAALNQAMENLVAKGSAFRIPVLDQHGKELIARGRAVGSMAVVWLEEAPLVQAGESKDAATFRAILDALPVPVWLRDKALALTWANHAFLKSTGAANLEAAPVDLRNA